MGIKMSKVPIKTVIIVIIVLVICLMVIIMDTDIGTKLQALGSRLVGYPSIKVV